MDCHLDKLALVFQEFAEAGLKLILSKCSFLKSSVVFLIHTVDKSYLVFGSEKRFPYDILVSPRKPIYSEDYSQSQLKALHVIRDEVQKSLQASRAEMLVRKHSEATAVSIAIGDAVFKAAPKRQVKLNPKFYGPYIVKDRLHDNKFLIFLSCT